MSPHQEVAPRIVNGKKGEGIGTSRRRGIRAAALLLLVGASIGVRSFGLLDRVFTDDGVVLQSVDPWVHLRRVHALTRDFNQDLTRDPYLLFPHRTSVPVGPLFDAAAAMATRISYGPEASDDEIATVCAWIPPIIAALTVIVVYLLATRLAGPWAGLIAAAWITVGPGLFFYNSRLGAADHHVLEVFLSTLFALFLILALHSGRDATGGAGSTSKAVTWSLLGGVTLALYLWTWIGGVYWMGIIAVWVVVQFGFCHWRNDTVSQIVVAVVPGLGVACALLAFVPLQYPMRDLQFTATTSVLGLALVLAVIAWLCRRRNLPRFWFPTIALTMLVAGGIIAASLRPDLIGRVRWLVSRLQPGASARTIEEVTPLFYEYGSISLRPAWAMFETGLPIALLGLILVAWRALRKGHAGYTFLAVWSVIGFICMAGQNRFGYYAAINVALLVGTLCAWLILVSDRRRYGSGPRSRSHRWHRVDRGKPRSHLQGQEPVRSGLRAAVAFIALAIVFGPTLYSLPGRAQEFDGPTGGWVSALMWLRRNTPEPFGDASFYYHPDRAPDAGKSGVDPFGIMSAWDHGYWVTAIARRTPCANPTQAGAGRAGRFFTETGVSEAARIMDEAGARYVVLDSSAVAQPRARSDDVGSTFPAMIAWSNRNRNQYYEFFLIRDDFGGIHHRPFYYPRYFESMASRLYTFGGQPVPAARSMVLRYDVVQDESGRPMKRVQAAAPCTSEADCQARLNEPTPFETVLVSDRPFQSCIALEALESFQLVFETKWVEVFADRSARPEVRVFEFVPSRTGAD